MKNRKRARLGAVICLVQVVILGYGCGGGAPIASGGGPIASRDQHLQQQVGTEYLLDQAGFRKWPINQNMPNSEALLSALPKRTIVTYRRDGIIYHAYGDKDAHTLYIGDELAYQRYLSLAEGKKQYCERREGGGETARFWVCFDELRQKGGGLPGK